MMALRSKAGESRISLLSLTSVVGLRLGLRKLLGTGVRNSRIGRLLPSRSGPSTGFDKLSLFPGLDLLELCELHGRVWLLQESRNAGGGESADHGGVASFDCHPFRGAAEGPSQPGKPDDHSPDSADD